MAIDAAQLETAVTTDPARRKRPRPGGRSGTRWFLAALLLVAFALRVWNLDWDRNTHLQPDERFWADVASNTEMPADWSWSEVLDPEKSSLNPRVYKPNYVYGTLPLWASEATAAVLMTDTMSAPVELLDGVGVNLVNETPTDAPTRERLRFDTGYNVNLIGRLLSAIVDTLTVGAVFLLARELTDDNRVGLLAAVLQTFTVLHIQYAHFLGSEPWVAFFVTCAVWGSVRIARGRGSWRTRAGTAVAVGLAIASKLSGVAAVAAPAAAALIAIGPQLPLLLRSRIPSGTLGTIGRRLEPFLLMALGAVVAYRIAQPYDFRAGLSLVFNERFSQDLEYLSDINQGGNWPWVQPLVGRTPLLHPLNQMFWWGMGPGLGLAAFLGLARAVRRFFAGERYWAVPIALVGAYFVLVSLQFYAIVRYLQPAYPALAALAAAFLIAAWRFAGTVLADRTTVARMVRVGVALAIGITVLWGLAFVNGVYGNTNARLAAGDWMVENLPPDAVVSQQAWDDGLPFAQASSFGRVTLEPFSFGGDSPQRIELLIAGLDEVDYVIESSNKFYDALPRTPARFPQMSRYYETLFDGSLGFELVREFRNPPSLFGVTIDDRNAEEAFTLYDHPTVYIWQKTDRFSVERAMALLNPDRARVAINAEPRDANANASMLRPDDYVAQQTGSSYSDVHFFDPSSPVAAILWFAVLQVVSLAVAPTLVRRAGRAGGAAYGLSKPLGLLLFAMPVWLLVSWDVATLSRSLIWMVLLSLVAVAAWRAWSRRSQFAELWRNHKRLILAAEAVFVGVFLLVLWLRASNPDVWHPWRGGEKPMELAYLSAVTGSTTLPPYDPWLAGGSLNYYYLGWFLLAVPIRLLGLAPDVGFNLGVATYAALAAITVFSTAAMLAQIARRRATAMLAPRATGLVAVVLFLVIGNLDGFRQLVTQRGQSAGEFDWWDPSRVVKNSAGFEVTEFPNFTVLFADLHPHFMAMPIFGLGLAGAIALIERARSGRRVSSWYLAVGLGVGSGIMRMMHTWDLPAFAVLTAGSIALGWILARGPIGWRVRIALAQMAAAGAAHLAITAPYRANNQVADSGFSRSLTVTPLDDWLVHWGLFLFVAVTYIASRLWANRARLTTELALVAVAAAGLAAIGFVTFSAIVGVVAALAVVALFASLLVLLVELTSTRTSTATPLVFVAASLALAFGILIGVETFTQNADIARLNTVFKFWLQVWHLFAIAAAFAVGWLLGPVFATRSTSSESAVLHPAAHRVSTRERLGRRAQPVFAVGLVGLLVASLVYPVLAVAPRQANRIDTTLGPSLDGDLWLEPDRYRFGARDAFDNDFEFDPGRDRGIIDWLQANVEGRPTIVEAVGGSEYQWWGRISIHTGLPTVLGWRWHQVQQRTLFDAQVNQRKFDVADFYTTTDPAVVESFLRAYDVSYVIVGSLESASANPATLDLFAGHPALDVVFGDPRLGIYRVDKAALAIADRPLPTVQNAN